MEIKLNRAYSSGWDNIEYPIYQLSDESYLCIAYSRNHKCYYIDVSTKEDFIEQGFDEEPYCDDIFENMTRQDIDK